MNTDRFLTRVWDTQEKKMIYFGDSVELDGICHYCYCGVFGDKIIFSQDITEISIRDIYKGGRFIPMQCTTLQAKGGEMIYEGDILKVDWGSERNTDILKPLNKPFVMEFRHSSWFPFCHALPFQENIEIIGNIREHPEFLEESK